MQNRTQIYWLAQIGGWGLFVFGNILVAKMQSQEVHGLYIVSLCIFLLGIFITHLFRGIILYFGWKRMNILSIIFFVIPSSLILSFIFTSANTALNDLINNRVPLVESFGSRVFWQNTFNFSVLFLLWGIIYFAVNTFENWKREEIKNLELRAAKTEIELNSFKSQMNPHFMFNSMNSIRALIDEDPTKAKLAITMLSGLLRNNLTHGKRQTIPLKEELDLVDKYLSLEKIRFEERLQIEMDVAAETLLCEVPPFMIQTIVENGIKHGISKRLEGGLVRVRVWKQDDTLNIEVVNSGDLVESSLADGIGIANTRTRLYLLYAKKASFNIEAVNGEVIVKIVLPV
jgi:sensor histidine kinase YesM